MTSFNLQIGAVSCLIQSEAPGLRERLQIWYKGFESKTRQEPFMVLDVGIEEEAFLREEILEESSESASLIVIRRDNFSGYIDFAHRYAKVTLISFNDWFLETFLRILYSLLMVKKGGILVHASGTIKEGKGYGFCGPSGSGKTTIAKLSNSGKVLSDEMVIVRKKDGLWQIFSTPFWGELRGQLDRKNWSAPLEAFLILEKEKDLPANAGKGLAPCQNGCPASETGTRLERLSPSQGLVSLMPNIFLSPEGVKLSKEIFDLCCDFVLKVPLFRLRVLPNKFIWMASQKRDPASRGLAGGDFLGSLWRCLNVLS